MNVTYNSAGSIAIVVDFYHSVNSLDTSQNYSFSSRFSVGGSGDASPNAFCDTSRTGDLDGQHHVFSSYSTFYDRASVTGYNGYLNFNRSVSGDGKRITLTASNPLLATRDYRCVTYTLTARVRSSASNLYSDYDSACDCWYVQRTLDEVGELDSTGVFYNFWFAGFRPIAPPPSTPQPEPLRLSKLKAKRLVKKVLSRQFGRKFKKRGKGSYYNDCRRKSPVTFSCYVSWDRRLNLYYGYVRVRRTDDSLARYRLKIGRYRDGRKKGRLRRKGELSF